MPETLTKNYKPDYSISGGIIEIEDFNTNLPNKNRISNQVNAIIDSNRRKEEQKYKNMTLEELKEMKIVSNTTGRPSSNLTDEKWQKEFNVRKMFVRPYDRRIKKMNGLYANTTENGNWDEEKQGLYHGYTNWQSYCSFINGVLDTIRSGQVDFCYYIYQIMDLARFHYNDLKTKYYDGYWEVWLEKKS